MSGGRGLIEELLEEEREMFNRVKELISLVVGSRLEVSGTGRTFAQAPMWLAVIAAICSPQLAVITALLIIAFGMRVSIQKA